MWCAKWHCCVSGLLLLLLIDDDDMMRVRECGVQSGTFISLVCCLCLCGSVCGVLFI